jgi:hypothetical protein
MTAMDFESESLRKKPLVSADAMPLKHLVGNEYEMQWDSLHLYTPREAIYIEYTHGKLRITTRLLDRS